MVSSVSFHCKHWTNFLVWLINLLDTVYSIWRAAKLLKSDSFQLVSVNYCVIVSYQLRLLIRKAPHVEARFLSSDWFKSPFIEIR